jgi:hypothetical protein
MLLEHLAPPLRDLLCAIADDLHVRMPSARAA